MNHSRSLLLTVSVVVAAAILSGCGATLPTRTGYDRKTGTYKPAPGAKGRKATPSKPAPVKAVAVAPAVAAVAPDDTTISTEIGTDVGFKFKGQASFYGKELAGNSTSSGEIFDPDSFTCAHRTLPFGTRLQVTYLKKSSTTTVRVNDRGPHKDGRILDLSRAAADVLGLTADGVGLVEAEVVP
ncbi:MAG: septal ring lytic transglycosylase RlpA family protein [Fibrobacterota bacterium]